MNQKKLRTDIYNSIKEASLKSDIKSNDIGKKYILPSSYIGGPRYMSQKRLDAMAYVGEYGKPDLFITFTCNPKWEEI